MYILNEKKYIEEILNSKIKPNELSFGYFMILIAKYYFKYCNDKNELCKLVKNKIIEFNLNNYQEYKYHKKILKICNDLYNKKIDYKFKELDYIPIYENEINLVNSLDNDRQKKIMFTLFILARYMNCGGWVNKKDSKGLSEIFKLSNITLSSSKRGKLLNELYNKKYIYFGKQIDNLNIKVNLDESGDIVYKLTDFKNIGNQYIGNFKKGYKQCKNCGKIIKRATNNNNKYCNNCAKNIQFDQKHDWDSKNRKIRKSSNL